MRTLTRSIIGAASLAAATCLFAQSGGGPPSEGADPSRSPCRHCVGNEESEADAPALAVAPADQPDGSEQQAPAPAASKAEFSVEGMFVDCCSCRPPCPCELTEVAPGCRGVGVHQISGGTYAGAELAGVRIAHAKVVGQWVNLYIDVQDAQQRPAAEEFGRAAFAAFGPIREVKAAEIEISGADGRYVVTVEGGKLMRIETEPLLGGDGKTPIGYTNIKNAVNPAVFQGTVVSATYSDGDKTFTVEKGRNAHFNPRLKSRGKI